MRQILSVSCITGVDSSLQVPRYPLATQLEGPNDCGSKGPPRLTGTLMASTGEPTEKQASGFGDKTTLLASRDIWILRSRYRYPTIAYQTIQAFGPSTTSPNFQRKKMLGLEVIANMATLSPSSVRQGGKTYTWNAFSISGHYSCSDQAFSPLLVAE